MTEKGLGKMKKNFTMLAKGISLVLMLSLVLSTAVFADTATYTFQKDGYTYIQNDTSIYSNTNVSTSTGASYNNAEKVTFYKFGIVSGPDKDTVKTAAKGGVLLKLPMENLAIPEGATVTKATLKLLMRYNNTNDAGTTGDTPMGPSLRILLHNVNKTEGEAIVAAGAVEGNVPQSVTNYLADVESNNFPINTYTNGYVNLSLAADYTSGNVELGAPYSGTKIKDAFHTFDVTDFINGGSLTEDRYILAQRGFLYDETDGSFKSGNAYLLPQGDSNNNAAPVLTVEYTMNTNTDATGIESHKSLKDEDTIVTFAKDYGYTITFNGDVNGATLTKDTVIIKDSKGTEVDLNKTTATADVITYNDQDRTVTILLPVDTSEVADDGQWLTAGETYTVTLTDGVKDTTGKAVFAEGNSDVTFTVEAKEYEVAKASIKVGDAATELAGATAVYALNEGATGTQKDQKIWAEGSLYNYTAQAAERFCMIAVYDEDGILVQCGIQTGKAIVANQMTSESNPGMTLNQNLKAGYVIKSYVWNQTSMKPYVNTNPDLNGTNLDAITEIVIGAN